MPPITMAYLAAALEAADIDVEFYDDVVHDGDQASLEARIRASRPDVVGISVVTGTVGGATRAATIVRKADPGIKIVMGNIHADIYYEQFLRAGLADFVVHNEGEITFVELVRELAKASPSLETVAGISFTDGGEVFRNEPRPFIEDLDTVPFPAWHLFPIEKYRIFNFARVKEPGTLILGSRGCPFKCTFCSLIANEGNTRRKRSVKSIADECEWLYDRFGYKQVSFVDPIFPFYKKEGIDFSEEMIRRGLHEKMVWITETRTDLVDYELMVAMREGGLRRVMFGFETGSPEQLKRIRKGAKVDRGIEAARAAKQAGVGVVGFFMIGIPGSTHADIKATIEYASRVVDIDFAKFTVFVPYPGTADYDNLVKAGALEEPENWDRFTSYPTRNRPAAYVPDGMTVEDLIRYQKKAYFAFYFRPHVILDHLFRSKTLSWRDAMAGLRLVARPSAA
jgi:anaerobic magnesium-protoporphyrin IX monomethyl ester cyclase